MEMTKKKSNASGKNDEAAKELEYLKSLVGSLETEEEIVKLALYTANSSTEEEFNRKIIARRALFKDAKINRKTLVIQDMKLYQKMFQTSAFFLQRRMDDDSAYRVLSELNRAVGFWLSLTVHNALGTLMEVGDVQNVRDSGGTPAEVFLSYLNAYKKQRGFEIWTLDTIVGMKHSIFVFMKELLHERKRKSTGNCLIHTRFENKCEHIPEAELPPAMRQKISSSAAPNRPTDGTVKDEQVGSAEVDSRLSLTSEVIAQAKKVEEIYLVSQEVFDTKSAAYDKAVARSSEAKFGFPTIAASKLDSVTRCIDSFKVDASKPDAEASWSLDKARNLLQEFGAVAEELKEYFAGYIEPLAAEVETMNDKNFAYEEREKWARKKDVVEQAAKAIEALKELMN